MKFKFGAKHPLYGRNTGITRQVCFIPKNECGKQEIVLAYDTEQCITNQALPDLYRDADIIGKSNDEIRMNIDGLELILTTLKKDDRFIKARPDTIREQVRLIIRQEKKDALQLVVHPLQKIGSPVTGTFERIHYVPESMAGNEEIVLAQHGGHQVPLVVEGAPYSKKTYENGESKFTSEAIWRFEKLGLDGKTLDIVSTTIVDDNKLLKTKPEIEKNILFTSYRTYSV